MWYRREYYNEHNNSLDRFISLFNSCGDYNIIMLRNPVENAKHDGLIINMNTGKVIGFDWNKSTYTLFENGKFVFKKSSVINSKLDIETNILFITTDIREKQFNIVFRDDYLNSPITYFVDYPTALGGEEVLRARRLTKHFKTYNYTEIGSFKALIERAFDTNTYNKDLFMEVNTL